MLASVSLAQEVVQFPTDCDCSCDNNQVANLIQAVGGGASLLACALAGGPILLTACLGGSLAAVGPALIGLGNCAAIDPPECSAVCACDSECTKVCPCPQGPGIGSRFGPLPKSECCPEGDEPACLEECYNRVLRPDCPDIPCEGDVCNFAGQTEAVELRENFFACGWCDFDPAQVQPCQGDFNSPGEANLCQEMLDKTDGRCGFNMVAVTDVTPDCPEGCQSVEVLGAQKCIQCSGLQPFEICQQCGGTGTDGHMRGF